MKLNVTRNLTQELVVPALSIKQDIRLGDKIQNRSNATPANRTMSGRTTSALINGNSISVFTHNFYRIVPVLAHF